MSYQSIRIERIKLSSIQPDPDNPRLDLQPGDRAFEDLSASLDDFGYLSPLAVDTEHRLISGHQRLKVMLRAGTTEADVIVAALTPEQRERAALALNKIQGDWDYPKLALKIDALIKQGESGLESTGFMVDEARDLIADMLESGKDDQEESGEIGKLFDANGPPVTQLGDLIELGTVPGRSHRLICGDCTDGALVQRLMGQDRAQLFATDPPYLVGYDTWDDPEENADLYERCAQVALSAAIRPDAAWYWWYASRRHTLVERAWEHAGAFAHCQIIWAKNKGVPTRTWYMWQHEPCLMGWLKGNRPPNVSGDKLTTVWNIDTLPNGSERPDHPTPKPLELFEIPMRQHTRRGDVCYEPFAGSGTQFIAAERLGRRCFGLELSPAYCDLIVRRFITFAGEDAVAPEVAERYRLPAADDREVA